MDHLTLIFVCQPENDLYRVLARLSDAYPRCDTLDRALEAAPHEATVLSLADTYPRPSPAFEQRHADRVRAKQLRLYVEYPASLPGIDLGEPRPTRWAFHHDEETVSYAPHYQAYLWAAYLLAYALTGFEGFLERTRTAIRMTMEVYPRWRWANGLTQEMARMLLPLSFLIRVEDTTEHRDWLALVSEALLAQMQPCGAIRELLGPLENGRYGPPAFDEAYGTTETPLIQENGDPACDLLYTTNYAFLGLHEAAAATGGAALQEAEDRLARFLCRVQVRSEAHPYLDGSWMRGFDYKKWECWGSSGDLSWGAWSVESGWTNTWIGAVLAMREQHANAFDLATSRPLQVDLDGVLATMLDSGREDTYR